MRKTLLALAAFTIICAKLPCQSQIPRIYPHPLVELEANVVPDPAWSSLDDTTHLSFASTDAAFERHRVPLLNGETHSWSGIAWRGERVHAQVLVWSKKPLSQLRTELAVFKAEDGHTIPVSAIRTRFVRYVLSGLPLGSRRAECGENKPDSPAYLVPDLLDTAERFEVPGSTTRPIWITIDVPRDAEPGLYRGAVIVKAAGGVSQSLFLGLEVQGGIVPAPAEWSFRVDFWQNPWAVAEQHRVEPWSSAHLAILREHLKLLADMGQTYVSAYITDSPWNDDTYVMDNTMVEWIREPDGSFSFDYRIFDTYAELAMAAGIRNAISCFTMVPWDGRVRYLDRRTGEHRWEKWATDSTEYTRFWKVFLADLRGHLTRKGWFGKAYLEINERSLADTLGAIKIARADSVDWKITYAGDAHPELIEPIDDLCTVLGHETSSLDLQKRRQRRQTSTFYVCCTPPFPNDFPFSPPVESVWMGWHAAAAGMDGFLRWAWDNWPVDPLHDSRHVRFPAGDTFIAYPGPRASIRMERLREGFVDYEKVRLVRKKLNEAGSTGAKEALIQLERALSPFSWEQTENTSGARIAEHVKAARAALAEETRMAFPARLGPRK